MRIKISILTFVFLTASSLLFGQAGTLDTTFSHDGKVTTLFIGPNAAISVVVQDDGKIVTAGYAYNGAFSNDFVLIRYNPDGSFDTTFGIGGVVTSDFGGVDAAYSVIIQADGKILAAGYTYNDGFRIALSRYNIDGSLDDTFGSGGKVITETGGTADEIEELILLPDHKILAAGTTNYVNGIDNDFILLRYDSTGVLDNTFDFDGMQTTNFGFGSYAADLIIQPDGKAIAAGYGKNGTYIQGCTARYNENGSLDTAFSEDGITTIDIGSMDDYVFSVALQADNKIVAGGCSGPIISNDFLLIRLNTDGSYDTSFNSDGTVIFDIGGFNDVGEQLLMQTDGKIILTGYSENKYLVDDFCLVRFNSNGSLDYSFGDMSIVTTDFDLNEDVAYTATMQPDNKIILAGKSYSDYTNAFALARYLMEDINCADIISLSPSDLNTDEGNEAVFITGSSIAGADYQWQEDLTGEWMNITDGGQFSGAANDTLIVSDVTLLNNNQNFRCLVTIDDCADTSEAAVLTVNPVLGFANAISEGEFVVFPNPAQGEITIFSGNTATVNNLKIFNLSGQVIFTEMNIEKIYSIDIAAFASGFYFIELNAGGSVTRLKFLKE